MLLFLYESRRRISIISNRIKKRKKKKGKRKTIEFFIFFNLNFYFFFFYGILDISKAPMKNKYRVNMKNVWKKKGKSFIIHFFFFFYKKRKSKESNFNKRFLFQYRNNIHGNEGGPEFVTKFTRIEGYSRYSGHEYHAPL